MIESDWIAYKCKSGQTVFLYNKVTGVHKWPPGHNDGLTEDRIILGEPVQVKELHSIAIQTDDHGCKNGCTSMHINTDPVTDPVPQPQQSVTMCTQHNMNREIKQENAGDNHIGQDELHTAISTGCSSMYTNTDHVDETCYQLQSNVAVESQHELMNKQQLQNVCVISDIGQAKKEAEMNTIECSTTINLNAAPAITAIYPRIVDNVNDLKVEHDQQNGFVSPLQYKHEPNTDEVQTPVCSKLEEEIEFPPANSLVVKLDSFSQDDSIDFDHQQDNSPKLEKPVVIVPPHEWKNLKCSFCSKQFKFRSVLMNHLRVHTNEKPFACSVCDKRFSQKAYLTIHFRTHTKEKPFECSICDKRYSQQSNLQTHLKRHSGCKPFECSFCNKKFVLKAQLTSHLRTHTKEKPYKCCYCKKSFSQKSNYSCHLKIHSGLKSFQCQFCHKAFCHKQYYDVHLRIHLGVKPYECSTCGKKFTQQSNLKKHTAIHNKQKSH